MSKNVRYIIITLLICAASAFSINQITTTVAHDAQVNAQNSATLSPGYWIACQPGSTPLVMHVTGNQDEYTDLSQWMLFYTGTSKPTAAQVKETCQ